MQDHLEIPTALPSTIEVKARIHGNSEPEATDLSNILSEFNLDFFPTDHYWQVGILQNTQGWILHLSVIVNHLIPLLKQIIPLLQERQISFKVARNTYIASKLLNGDYGAKLLGKVITIYPPTDEKAAELASILVEVTAGIKGPTIPTDFLLSNILYTRYGSFSPVYLTSQIGKQVKHIYNEMGRLIEDNCPIPFSFPVGIAWPFHHITRPVLPKSTKLINARYYPIETIAENPKGNIIKAIYFRNFFNIKACILKQGRQNMFVDEIGRDVSNRLKWQYDLCTELLGIIPVPKIFDFFLENGDTYLAMEYVKGKTIWKWLDEIYEGHSWFELSTSNKTLVLTILLRIIDIIHRLHQYGLIHRDITPANFIITRTAHIIPIDLELAWSFKDQRPDIPFPLGTPGYMSSQQENGTTPTIKDDIYGLGALAFVICTNISPRKISTRNQSTLQSALTFLTQNEQISKIISDCLRASPEERPDLPVLKDSIQSCISNYESSESGPIKNKIELASKDRINSIIQFAINGLANPSLLGTNGHWISVSSEDNITISQQNENSSSFGWYAGSAGPLWVVALAKSNGFNVDACIDLYKHNWTLIQALSYKDLAKRDPSLFYGSAGIALALKEGLNSGLLKEFDVSLSCIKDCFLFTADGFTTSLGLPGQGLALLQVEPLLDSSFVTPLISNYVTHLIESQQPNGSWLISSNFKRKKKLPLGLNEGVSGIIWFLLSCLQRSHSDTQLEISIRKALTWLTTDKTNTKEWNLIYSDTIDKEWYSNQTSGDLVILMIKAFAVLGDNKFKIAAETYLECLPHHPVLSNFSLAIGLSRLGEIYLEAFTILKKQFYLERASWIASLLVHTFLPKTNKTGDWKLTAQDQTTNSLFTGVSGIIHFLLRYTNNSTVPHPF